MMPSENFGDFSMAKRYLPQRQMEFEPFFWQAKAELRQMLDIPTERRFPADLKASLYGFSATRYLAAQPSAGALRSDAYEKIAEKFAEAIDEYRRRNTKAHEPRLKGPDIVKALEAQMQQWLGKAKPNGHGRG